MITLDLSALHPGLARVKLRFYERGWEASVRVDEVTLLGVGEVRTEAVGKLLSCAMLWPLLLLVEVRRQQAESIAQG